MNEDVVPWEDIQIIEWSQSSSGSSSTRRRIDGEPATDRITSGDFADPDDFESISNLPFSKEETPTILLTLLTAHYKLVPASRLMDAARRLVQTLKLAHRSFEESDKKSLFTLARQTFTDLLFGAAARDTGIPERHYRAELSKEQKERGVEADVVARVKAKKESSFSSRTPARTRSANTFNKSFHSFRPRYNTNPAQPEQGTRRHDQVKRPGTKEKVNPTDRLCSRCSHWHNGDWSGHQCTT